MLANPTRGLRALGSEEVLRGLCPVLLAWVSLSKHLVSSDSKFPRVVQPRPACDLNVKGERDRKRLLASTWVQIPLLLGKALGPLCSGSVPASAQERGLQAVAL